MPENTNGGSAPKGAPRRKFKVTSPILLDGTHYKPGKEIELTAAQAKELAHAIEKPQTKATVDEEAKKISEALGAIESALGPGALTKEEKKD
jgi:hypothetical protein